ncbi:hypothetical protein HMPREF1981_00125 [Bacteroides pyogenes F0041]|uniref:Uncharacterized protein n=1 Tax=Bacteroides pyogenes F0041 TaxID=1321819 RepID=U2CF29_9BACE|nr:hypothetical protein HMPREF1981_00125 [Bacteroides pyogenes F0041]
MAQLVLLRHVFWSKVSVNNKRKITKYQLIISDLYTFLDNCLDSLDCPLDKDSVWIIT